MMNTRHEMDEGRNVLSSGVSSGAPGWVPSRGALWGVAAMVVLAGTTMSYGQATTGASERLAELEELAAEYRDEQPGEDGWSESDTAALEGDVLVDENELVELHVRDEDLRTVLQMLSIQSQRSIVPTQNVSGTVTANLYGKTFTEALESILLYNGFGYIEQGGTIFVLPIEEVRAIEAETQTPVARVVRLDYMNATDAAAFARVLLSESGSITTNGQTEEFSIASDAPSGSDEYANDAVLLIYDFEPRVDAIESVLAELDTRPEQVLIETTILQTAISEANAFGVDFAIIADLEFVDFTPVGGPLRVVDSLIAGGGSGGGGSGDGGDGGDGGGGTGGATVPDSLSDGSGFGASSTVGQTGSPGGFKVGVINDDISVFVRMLDEVGDTTIISNPKILTLNRQEARVQVGRRVGYLSTTTTDTSTSQTVEFLDTGTQLYVRPFLSANQDTIRMELRPEVSQPLIRTVTDATGAAVTVPDEDTSHLITNVIVRDSQTIVLGGLFTERTTATRRQVPIAGDLPLIGAAFRGHDDSIDRSEIVFMVTPSKVNDEVLLAQGEEATAHVEYLRAGSREGLLPWSREKRSSQLLIEAERLHAQGDTKGALHKVRRSLQLSPVSTDAIRLRESLLAEPTVWPSRSMLEQIVNDEAAYRALLLARSVELQQQLADGSSADSAFDGERTEGGSLESGSFENGSFEGGQFTNVETGSEIEDSQFEDSFEDGFDGSSTNFQGDNFNSSDFQGNEFDSPEFNNGDFDSSNVESDTFNHGEVTGFDSQGGRFDGSRFEDGASSSGGSEASSGATGEFWNEIDNSSFDGEFPEDTASEDLPEFVGDAMTTDAFERGLQSGFEGDEFSADQFSESQFSESQFSESGLTEQELESASGFRGDWPEADGFDAGWETGGESASRITDSAADAWEVDWSGVADGSQSPGIGGERSENEAQGSPYSRAFNSLMEQSWRMFGQFSRTPVIFGGQDAVLTNVDEDFDSEGR